MHIFWDTAEYPTRIGDKMWLLGLSRMVGRVIGPGAAPFHFRLTVWVVASSRVIARIVAGERSTEINKREMKRV